MKVKVLSMDWYDKFQCIGGKCPYTCCCTSWKIIVLEKEIEQYENLEHPFQESLLKAIDKENKCMCSQKEQEKCALLTSEGLCQLVIECGEEYLPNTCKIFPRITKQFGDVLERTVGISCPVVAENLFLQSSIDFCFGEIEQKNIKIEDIDYEVYDGLSMARTQLVELLQSYNGLFATGKMYIMLSIMYKLKQLINENKLTRNHIEKILDYYQNLEVITVLFKKGEEIAYQYEEKACVLQNFLVTMYSQIALYIKKWLVDNDNKLQNCIVGWMADIDVLKEDIKGFLEYFRKSYQNLFENYFVYSLFLDWININEDKFGNLFAVRCIGFTMIQIFAMAWWKVYGKIKLEDYVLMCVYIERGIFHSSVIKENIYQKLKDNDYDNFAVLLELCLC